MHQQQQSRVRRSLAEAKKTDIEVRRTEVEVRRTDMEDMDSQPPPNIAPISGVPNYSVRIIFIIRVLARTSIVLLI
jgi:hypothetical protein